MAKLILKQQDDVIAEYDLDVMPESFSAGSAEDNDIVISDANVNLNHLQFQMVQGRYTVRDIWSGFGTLYNGNQLVKTVALHHGDRLEIGDYTLVFEEENIQQELHDEGIKSQLERAAAERKFQDDLEFSPYGDAQDDKVTHESAYVGATSRTVNEPATENIASQRSTVPIRRYCLLAISGPYLGKRYFLDKEEIRLGQNPQLNDIVIQKGPWGREDTSIPPRQATIQVRNGRYYLRDNWSELGTYVNQHRLDVAEEVSLSPGDEIRIVSKLKSSIFRFVEYGNWDFSPPKKAGLWWVRNGRFVWLGLSVLIASICLILTIRSYSMHAMLLHRPDQVQAQGAKWLGVEETADNNRVQLDEAGFAYTPAPAMCDLNHDGIPDILYVNHKGNIAAISGQDKIPLWSPIQVKLEHPRSVTFTDLNHDGITDILAIISDSRLLIFDGSQGTLMSTSPAFADVLVGRPAVAEINGDRDLDVIIAGRNGMLHIGISQGWNQKWESIRFYGDSQIGASATDLDGDGQAEILIGSDEGIVHIYSYKNKEFQKININEELRRAKSELFAEQNSIRCPVTTGPIHGKRLGIFISTLEHNLIALEVIEDGGSTKRLWYGEFMASGRQYPTYHAAPVIIDFDGDNKSEIVLSSHNGAVMAFTNEPLSGRALPMWMFIPDSESDDAFIAEPGFADIDKDGVLDVVVAGVLGRLYAISGNDGSTIFEIPLSEYPFSAPPVIGDINADNRLDIVVIDVNYDLYKITTNTIVPRGSVFWSGDALNYVSKNFQARKVNYRRISIISFCTILLVLSPHIIFWWRRKRLRVVFK